MRVFEMRGLLGRAAKIRIDDDKGRAGVVTSHRSAPLRHGAPPRLF